MKTKSYTDRVLDFWKYSMQGMIFRKYLIISFLLIIFLVNAQQKTWSLNNCLDYALENNLSVRETALNSEIAAQQITAAYGNLLPNVYLYADHQYNFGSVIDPTTNARMSSDIQSNSFSFSSNIELFNWGNFVRIKSAKLQKEKAKYELEIKKNELIIQIVQAFYQLQFDQEQLALLEAHKENNLLNLQRIKTEVELGNKAKSDLYEMQASLANDEQNIIAAKNAVRVSRLNLTNLLNLKEEIEIIPSEYLTTGLPLESLDLLYETGLQNRPEIKASDLQTEISQLSIQQEKSRYLPTISGNYSLSSFYVDVESSSLSNQVRNNKNHYMGISLNIPIFNRLQTRTAVQQSKIESEQAKLQAERQKQAYYKALSEAYTQTQNAFEAWQSAEKNVEAQQKSFEKTEEKFRQGMIDAYGFFAARNGLLSAQTALLQAKYTFQYDNALLNWYVTNEIRF